ncbi:hypothetical protein P692DRAFT_20882017 [Suillus brevipes Sb2]|nr:hypothetical protein P692DRAFT_20882017 [Suillus brevipes Sb2]
MSTNEANPSLLKGWLYFVEEADYKLYLAEHLGEAQEHLLESLCSKYGRYQAVPRTGMKQGNRVGNLQKGEKYINMDYMFFSTLRNISLKILNMSYDITC